MKRVSEYTGGERLAILDKAKKIFRGSGFRLVDQLVAEDLGGGVTKYGASAAVEFTTDLNVVVQVGVEAFNWWEAKNDYQK